MEIGYITVDAKGRNRCADRRGTSGDGSGRIRDDRRVSTWHENKADKRF